MDKGTEVVGGTSAPLVPIVVLLRTVRQFFSLFVSISQELELLSVRESVELLSAVAQLDTSEVSPCLIEISQVHSPSLFVFCLLIVLFRR